MDTTTHVELLNVRDCPRLDILTQSQTARDTRGVMSTVMYTQGQRLIQSHPERQMGCHTYTCLLTVGRNQLFIHKSGTHVASWSMAGQCSDAITYMLWNGHDHRNWETPLRVPERCGTNSTPSHKHRITNIQKAVPLQVHMQLLTCGH